MGKIIIGLILLTVVSGLNYALFAIGFVTYYRLSKRFDLLFAGYFIIGAYVAFVLGHLAGIFGYLLIPIFIFAIYYLAIIVDKFIYQPIERWTKSSELCLVTSLGLYFIVENCCALIFGDGALNSIPGLSTRSPVIANRLFRLSEGQLLMAVFSLIAFISFSIILYGSEIGMLARAAGSNQLLSRLHGIRLSRTFYIVGGATAVVSAFSGAAYSFDLEIYPSLGMRTLLVAVAISLSAKRSNPIGILLRSIVLAGLTQISNFLFGPRWSSFSTFIVFFVVVVWIGFNERILTLRRQ